MSSSESGLSGAPVSGDAGSKAASSGVDRQSEARATNTLVIKKYSNRRLYHTGASTYITLEDVRDLVLQDVVFVVVDAQTGEDLTRIILNQIIYEHESRGNPLFSEAFLRDIIRIYDTGGAHEALSAYLGWVLQQFIHQQDFWCHHWQQLGKGWSGDWQSLWDGGLVQQQRAWWEQQQRLWQGPLQAWMPSKDRTPGKDVSS